MRRRWTKEEDNRLIQNYQAKTCDILHLFPGRSHFAINQHATVLGIKKENNYYLETNCKSLLEDTPIVLYWIGFILADGHISNNKRLQITLAIKDIEHLKKLALLLNTGLTTSRKDTYPNVSLYCQDVVNIKNLSIKYDIKRDKTYSPPEFYNISSELILAMIIGLIDGDGHICKQSGRSDCLLSFHCHSSWLDFYTKVVEFLEKTFDLNLKKPGIKNDGYCNFNIAHHKVLNGLKRFAIEHKLPILDRKWDLIDLNRIYKTDRAKIMNKFILENPNLTNTEISTALEIPYDCISSARHRFRKKGLI